MSGVLLDTHAVIWYLKQSSQLSQAARVAIENALSDGEPVFVSAVSLAEMVYLLEKRRIELSVWQELIRRMRRPNAGLVASPLTIEIAELMSHVPYATVPDLPDRIIAATALQLGLPLVTRDQGLRSVSQLTTVW